MAVPGIIAVISEKGGGGKSTTAVHLARWLDQQGRRVLVVDADPTQAAATRWLREAAPGVRVAPAATPDELLEVDIGEADHVVIDGPAGLAEVSRAALLKADLALVPVAASALDYRAAQTTVRILRNVQAIRAGAPRAVLVANRVQMHTRLGRELVDGLESLGLPVAATVVRQRSAIADAPGQGTTVFDTGSAGREAAADFDTLFREILTDGAETQAE